MKFVEKLKSDTTFLGQETIGGIICNVGYLKEFKWTWFATQLNTFIITGETTEKVDRKMIENFSTACFNYAIKNNKGWPRGLQAGVGSIAILQAKEIDKEAEAFCRTPYKKHFSAFEIPVLYHTENKDIIRFTNNPLWGAIYMPYFKKIIDSFEIETI
jgi:hypothetical protein